MKALLFDFVVDKENHRIHVQREFAAGKDLVWQAWTDAALLDQWWAPKPYRAETKTMHFAEGGHWLYAMISPENEKQWCRANYEKIRAKDTFSYTDAFCDENGNVSDNFPNMFWTQTFTTDDQITLVDVRIQLDSLEALEMMVSMGFKEGFSAGLDNLDILLRNLNR